MSFPGCTQPQHTVRDTQSMERDLGYHASTLGYGSSLKLESDLVLGSNPANGNTKKLSQASVLEAERFI
ncbi:hypothetical protein N7465_002200 [Penicillium sp. CMV-2018d]|nr:hypothetical protein N7465_002200 [Penicillium sp. CMV-2018d]